MATAHVIFPINSWGDQGSVRLEVYFNGGFQFAQDGVGQMSQYELDVPENTEVRIDAVVNVNGQGYYSSSPSFNPGSAPANPNNPMPPQMPQWGSPYVAYWSY